MKFSERWLRTTFDPRIPSEALAHLLTMAGLEVEAREPVAQDFEGVCVARITAIEPHPNAERLKVCFVDVGSETLQVVCGAPNARVGMRVACAVPGARLPGMAVARVQVRGSDSSGMLCSERELGLGDDHSGLMDLGETHAVGMDLREALELDDFIFTLKLTPNRGDCLSIHGLARELAALTRIPFESAQHPGVPARISERRAIHLEAGDACPRYCGRVIRGVNPRARPPDWMIRRLRTSGLRPISALVDITNYVMLEMGQPLHAFDSGHLSGDIHVRKARAGERLTLLDGRQIDLRPNYLVIADDAGPVALAGVMGGEASAVSDTTQSVFLESAFFSPDSVAAASRGLEIASDAAHRFERGVDFKLAPQALERATELLLQICGGEAGPVIEALSRLPARDAIDFSPNRVRRMIGADVPSSEMRAILERLGLEVRETGNTWRAIPPSFRFDLAIEVDIVEEVARVHGYESIPATLPVASSPMLARPETRVSIEGLKQAIARRDYLEVVTFSFVDRDLERDFADNADPVALANPIATQMSVMRSSLLGSLVECVRFNVTRKQERVRIFEIAGCYRREGSEYRQVNRVAGICFGAALPEQWGERPRSVDFYDVRGDLEALLGVDRMSLQADTHPALHPGQSARVMLGPRAVGWLGALHPRLVQKYELNGATVAFELDIDLIIERDVPLFQAVSRFPAVRRDIALVVDEEASAVELQSSVQALGAPLVTEVRLFDIYRGKGVAEGKKSLAFRVLLQDTERTLTDTEVDAVVQRVIAVLEEKHGAVLRT